MIKHRRACLYTILALCLVRPFGAAFAEAQGEHALTARDAELVRFLDDYERRLSEEQVVMLRRAQRAWERLRRADCAFEASGLGSGSAYGPVLAHCLAERSAARLAYFRQLANCPEGDLRCPAAVARPSRIPEGPVPACSR